MPSIIYAKSPTSWPPRLTTASSMTTVIPAGATCLLLAEVGRTARHVRRETLEHSRRYFSETTRLWSATMLRRGWQRKTFLTFDADTPFGRYSFKAVHGFELEHFIPPVWLFRRLIMLAVSMSASCSFCRIQRCLA